MSSIISFSTKEKIKLSEVGGKAYSLILSTQNGWLVPEGFVLNTLFFSDWQKIITSSHMWKEVLENVDGDLKFYTDKVKVLVSELEFQEEQLIELNKKITEVFKDSKSLLMAVRSSSPEEDLDGASFAGGYETILGVTRENLQAAIKRAFASCLDERVLLYKKEKGFNIKNPKIAVVIQKQIASESSGVAFSLNPLNNCYDEAVINANFGLGESVVAGLINPDQYIVDKVNGEIIEKKLGGKKKAIWLQSDGGTIERDNSDADNYCLTNHQVDEIVKLVSKVENVFQKPVDIEWAFAEGVLYLLQARPITAFIPLPDIMRTKQGELRKLYLDVLIVKQGIHGVFSVLGEDYLSKAQELLIISLMGNKGVMDPHNGLYIAAGGRSYQNVSHAMKVFGKKRSDVMFQSQDRTVVAILKAINKKEYMPTKLPKELKGTIWGIIKSNIGLVKRTRKVLKKPDEYHEFFIRKTKEFKDLIFEEYKKDQTLSGFNSNTQNAFVKWFSEISMSTFTASELKRAKINKLFKNETQDVKEELNKLGQALPNNVTIEMGLSMYKLAKMPDIKIVSNGKEFAEKLIKKEFSNEFLSAWNDFMNLYGHRCPRELDIGTPRFHEQPDVFFKQLKTLSENTDPATNPISIFENGKKDREETYLKLLKIASKKGFKKKFITAYHILKTFGAYREIHKYYIILVMDLYRKKVREIGKTFVQQGRIDEVNDIFKLCEKDIEKAQNDEKIDIRDVIAKNTVFYNRVKHIQQFPRVIDSRGKIFHAPKKEINDGEIIAEPISSGIVRGRVKVLHSPDEKPLLPGEIMVTRATDPGWTPLFLNAGGIVLEVGGLLQHGALVAREYCKPCVAGIPDIFNVFKDGQLIEIDGAGGTIRFLDKE